MKPRPAKDQVWKHGSIHYKIIEIKSNGAMVVAIRNGSRGRFSADQDTLEPTDLSYLEFVKGPVPEGMEDEIPKTVFKRKIKKAKRYVITYAQNATPIHDAFFKTLLTYCKENKAELIVVPGRYKNPTSIWSQDQKHNDWWDSALTPYIIDKRIRLANKLTIYGDISIQPTAVRPLTGMEVFTGKSSAIFGHPKIQLMTVATDSRRPKLMTTTGSCTILNYTDSKAGKKAAAHHVFGATVVEINKEEFFVRQINALHDDGSFTDLGWVYTADGRHEAPPAEAVVMGDVHAENVEELALQASFDMIKHLKAKRAIFHDVLDFRTRNHHNIDDFCDRFERASQDFDATDSVEKELKTTIDIIEATPKCATPIIVASNHDEAFDRWLNTANPKTDPVNALLYHKMWAEKIEDFQKTGRWTSAFTLYYRTHGKGRAHFIGREETCKIKGVVCGYHGDKGINGSRGSSRAYAKLGVKTVIGHGHSPNITEGCYQVGVTGKLDQGYNDLPSSWAHANCVIYANGKRSLLFISPKTGEWKL